jgi:undecaprenyl-diphosphatase
VLVESSDFSLWQVLVLAVVQGIAEFLPISSDGHLVVVRPLLFGGSGGPANMMDLTIVLHMGTLGSILVYYYRRILELLGSDRRVLGLIVLGTIPAVVLVLSAKVLFDEWFEPALQSTLLAGFMLPVSGIALLWSLRHGKGTRDYRELSWIDSLLIGIAQATAILPGLSRSGTTIASGLARGMSRPAAATYSFLLAIPALAGAGVYEGFSMLRHQEPLSTSPTNLAIGAAVSFVVGLVALVFLNRVLQRGRLQYFGWYCIGLGLVVIAMHLAG